jgi:cytochrome c2
MVLAACSKPQEKAERIAKTGGGDEKRGRQLIDQYGCNSCHSIPGVAGPKGMVGPPLDHIGSRSYLAGKYPNSPETMMRWLQNPQAMDPQNAMPNLGISPADSRDITAFLFSIK